MKFSLASSTKKQGRGFHRGGSSGGQPWQGPVSSLFAAPEEAKEDEEAFETIIGNEFQTKEKEKSLGIPCKNMLPPLPRKKATSEEPSVEIRDGLNLVASKEGIEEAALSSLSGDPSDNKDLRARLFAPPAVERKLEAPLLKRNRGWASGDFDDELSKLPDVNPGDHDRVPIEGFGLAMLVGMGYDPSNEAKKSESKFAEELPVWRGAGLGAAAQMRQNKAELEKATSKSLPVKR